MGQWQTDRLGTTTLAFALTVILAIVSCRRSEPVAISPLERLVRASPLARRHCEARFSGGFHWAPFEPQAPQSPDDLEFGAVAGEILKENERSSSLALLHAAGTAAAMAGSPNDALSRLERVCALSSRDASVWNDLAVVRLAIAVARDDPQRLLGALSAADRALRLAPDFAEARFNRALILTHLGMRNEAMQAWSDALSVEKERAWTAEEHCRLEALRDAAATNVAAELQQAVATADRGDSSALDALIESHPEQARMLAETIMLTSWAEAFQKHDADEAARILERLRSIASALLPINHDRLLSDTLRVIVDSTDDRRQRLAKAQLAYRDARLRYGKRNPNSADELRHTADLFAREGSPMQYAARYYSGNALVDANRVEDAESVLTTAYNAIDADRYPSLAAGIQQELGLCHGFRGTWTLSLRCLQRSRSLFATRREYVNAAFVDAVIGEGYDRLGRFDLAWRHRVAALKVLTRSPPDYRSLPVMVGAVHAEITRGDYEGALSMLQIARWEADRVGAIPDVRAEMVLREARLLLITRGVDEAERALREARAVADTIEDRDTRARIEAEIGMSESAVLRRSDPCRAVGAALPAVAFFKSRGLGIYLPPAYLELGRAHLACGMRDDARTDFHNGLEWIEQQRANVAIDIRTAIFDTVPDLLGELVNLLLADGDQSGAYAVVERAHGRTLIEALGVSASPGNAGEAEIMAALPVGSMLIEYVMLPDGVAAFCIDAQHGLTVRRLASNPAELRRVVADLRVMIDERAPLARVQELSSRIHATLIQPLSPLIDRADVLYIVPDRFLNALPFAALYDARAGRYLIQMHRLVISPSGTFLHRRQGMSRRLRPALVIADPTGPGGGKGLSAARREAMVIADLYGRVPPLVGRAATIERFRIAAPRSALIHYAGHARDDGTAGFLPLAPSRNDDGRLDAATISRLPLRRTNLVILSACSTMSGDVSRVEGMPSLSRAFLTAGSRAVVGMLWDVDDVATGRLLSAFHRNLHHGMTPSEALQRAQIGMVSSGPDEFSHPAFWAAAELLGAD